MKRRHALSGSPFESTIGFSRAIRAGNTVAVSGTAPLNPDGTTAFPGNLYAQTVRCLEIAIAALAQVDAGVGDVVRTRVMLTDVSRWEEAARAHGEFFRELKPACTFVGVQAFIRPDWLVEIELDCATE